MADSEQVEGYTSYTSTLPWRTQTATVRHQDVDGRSYDVDIAWDVVGEGRPLLLIMGLAIQRIFWPDELCQDLVDRGFQVVRFDNRDIGGSHKVARGRKVNITRDFLLSRLSHRLVRANYTLDAMVEDTLGVMDAAGFQQAHVVGLSMGGIIGGMLAARHPERVRSLALIMSHTNHPVFGIPHPSVLLQMTPPPAGATAETLIRLNVDRFAFVAGSAYPRPREELERAFRIAFARDPDTAGLDRQTHALFASPCIDDDVARITAPTTIMHGLDDKLVLPINSRRLHARIKGSTLTMFPGMGHDFPPPLLPVWAQHIADNVARAGGGPA